MKNILLFYFLSVASLTVSTEELKWNAKFRLDLLEIKGPPSVEDVMNIRANKIADLDLLINSGKYDPEEIAWLQDKKDLLLYSDLPTQETLNRRHNKKIQKGKKFLKRKKQIKNDDFVKENL